MATRPTDSIRPHPRNAHIYRDGPDKDMVLSVRAQGVLEALLVTRNDVLISGHRRWLSAKAAGLAEVPVVVFASDDEADILEALIHCNKQRVKSHEQLAREGEVLMEVERERARRRQEEGQERGRATQTGRMVESVPPSEDTGKARDKVGEALGVSGKTVEKLIEAVNAIDQLEAAGRQEAAEEVRVALNTRGAAAGAKAAAAATALTPSADPSPSTAAVAPTPSPVAEQHEGAPAGCSPPPDPALRDELLRCRGLFAAARAAAANLRTAMREVAEAPGGGSLKVACKNKAKKFHCPELAAIVAMLRDNVPFAMGCCTCDGQRPDCPVCSGRGWVTRGVYDQLLPSHQAQLWALAGDEDDGD